MLETVSTRAVYLSAIGGPEVLVPRLIEVPAPGPGQIRIQQEAVGLNFIDVYVRTGLYPLLAPPAIPGMEAAGRVEAVGEGVTGLQPGDRVGYVTPASGAYTGIRNLPADRVIRLPDHVSSEMAAAMLLKGLTAEYLLHRTHRVQPGDRLLVLAAAGGVGSLLVPWAVHLGARVFGVVGHESKRDKALELGCESVGVCPEGGFEPAVMEWSQGQGCDVVYDSVGRTTFRESFKCLRPLGHLVSFGQSSGGVEPFGLDLLAARSATLSRPSLFPFLNQPGVGAHMAERLFQAVGQGVVRVDIGHRYPLEQAAQAHRDLETRQTTGSVVLLP